MSHKKVLFDTQKARLFGVFAIFVGCVAALPSVTSASSLYLYGAGARSVGLAGAHEPVANNYLATWASPANLAHNQRVHFGLGAHLVSANFGIDQAGGHDRYPSVLPQDTVLGHIGVSSPVGGIFGGRLGLGIHLHIPMSGPTRIAARDHRTPQVAIFDSIENRLAVVMGAGYRITDWLSLGASFQLLAGLQGRADFSLSILDRRFTRRSLHIDLPSAISPIASVLLTPTDTTKISLGWRSAASVHFKLPVQVDVERVGLLHFEVEGIGLFTPHQVFVSASQVVGKWTLIAAATWAQWSALPPMAPRIDLEIDDAIITSADGNEQLIVVRNRPVAMAAKDIVVPRIAAEFAASDWISTRLGFRYRPTPLPKADGTANYLDAPAWTVAGGVSFVLRDDKLPDRAPLTIDAALGWTGLQRRTVTKRDPNDPVMATSVHGYNLRFALTLHHDF